mmetsp:Transcript_36877/g.51216  ORF Transcript_36877/g.51216 Transcript_36877/m.51216 type:complete len:335 (-) Transcript_36877:173-1177(-)|eukprot:CAMPEP_0196571874 /NCGR_PEP_ID=MMETSP1081-20130531/2008_1 /TAXON_ID=36882 /ORGANISM="Pyramimonas amylifera, Strain CCMP720" /LENGTH=334 /DNA_ID=CAMNT_0041888999 /DNA_START=128 /DNA_END=1132 /DNA_ORIENTATION=-
MKIFKGCHRLYSKRCCKHAPGLRLAVTCKLADQTPIKPVVEMTPEKKKARSVKVQRQLAESLKKARDPYFYTLSQVEEKMRSEKMLRLAERERKREMKSLLLNALQSLDEESLSEDSLDEEEEEDEDDIDLPTGMQMGLEGVAQEVWVRGQWLLGLLVLQSASSIVLEANKDLIRDHLIITLFLTMLVGAGGNAGNQSAIIVIRGLATNDMEASWESFSSVVAEQALVGVTLGTLLALGGFLRVYFTQPGDINEAFAIGLSLFVIVTTSVVAGASLPFLLAWRGLDPANAGTTIQVVMDILGVSVTCVVCYLLLEFFSPGSGNTAADLMESIMP